MQRANQSMIFGAFRQKMLILFNFSGNLLILGQNLYFCSCNQSVKTLDKSFMCNHQGHLWNLQFLLWNRPWHIAGSYCSHPAYYINHKNRNWHIVVTYRKHWMTDKSHEWTKQADISSSCLLLTAIFFCCCPKRSGKIKKHIHINVCFPFLVQFSK